MPKIVIRIPRPTRGRKGRRATSMTAVACFIALGGTLFVLLGGGGVMEVLKMRARATQLRYEISRQHRATVEMIEEIRALKHDPEAIEKLAREELNMGRPGETIYFLPSGPPAPDEGSPEAGSEEEPVTPTAPRRPPRR